MKYDPDFAYMKCSPGMSVVFKHLGRRFGYCSAKLDKQFDQDIQAICQVYKVGRSVAYMYYKILRRVDKLAFKRIRGMIGKE